ncbi:hypothetical protein FQ082_05635 [Psychrobacter sp. ANT_H56B]|uniref:hypothetical protein n=1 Tax=Psychrobacter sp. ANT_H56B TaxID=2597353 RepID=UPI0011F2ED01|nr:hypothetical protein [Psychrobacter sp. ANT_H56B]KAA0927325.1 hypothetical protein FQ082_05635 [Psychrobacter sp. ANT_H56B]
MPMNSESLSKDPSALQQRRQANMFLLRLQWVVILLLIGVLLWLYISQQRFQHTVNERLQSNEQVVSRLNEMDDRLFAMSQQTLPATSAAVNSQAQNQLDLLRIQIQAADRLLADSNGSAAIDLLQGLHWQLSQKSNEIAPALTVVIKQSLVKDIERLQARSAQPSSWQLQNLAIQNIQDFLYRHERAANTELNSAPQKNTATSQFIDNSLLTRRQLTIHEAIMTLNLASQASNMHDRDQLVMYLNQARKRLQTLMPKQAESQASIDNKQQSDKNDLQTKSSPRNMPEVIEGLDRLIANAPKTSPLLTSQILNKPQR